MLDLLDDGNIVNDAEEMEILYLKAKSTANTDEKAETLKRHLSYTRDTAASKQ